ncbi:allophanate hydrolase [Aquabacter spiritensis]|uniref:Allophanate hydrolase n=1 Tax=Aquabacter spiritensis TaxID=933073 RepID=A0A4R3LWR9_9HYPH|nr:allophanate hydrolase [Aquabacter spiritensis]TCT05013.1 allophanate hydrolase [Aquabacter spiritensis]
MHFVPDSLAITSLRAAYHAGTATPEAVISGIYDRIEAAPLQPAWISVVPRAAACAAARDLAARRAAGEDLPLYGIPFAAKDNIDVAGLPTTAACPAFSYLPETSALAVERLLAAGAIMIGKTNLDQFATGLSGTRSPYGACASVFNPAYASGGSSSGSAVVVAQGLVSFALGTDTGGSGRVPAGFNNVVGLKPTIGRVSTRGLVPNCRTLDCVSVFALTVEDARLALAAMEGFDPANPFSRPIPDTAGEPPAGGWRLGVPRAQDLAGFPGLAGADLFAAACRRAEALGWRLTEVDLSPFLAAGKLMFGGAWVAERLAAFGDFIAAHPDDVLPVTRDIVLGARGISAADTFSQFYELAALKRAIAPLWDDIDALMVPTAGAPCRIDALQADPLPLNARFGHFSYFVNLLDLCAMAVPNGFLAESGVAMGVTFIAPAWEDARLARIGAAHHAALGLPPGLAGAAASPAAA